MTRIIANEIAEHDQLVLMMARYFKEHGFTDIKADIPGWKKPESIYWTNSPQKKYHPDLTCYDPKGVYVVLEAETCSTLSDQHTEEQFRIFRAHATNVNGRFEVVVPRSCQGNEIGKQKIKSIASNWGIVLDAVWTPSG